MGTRSWGLRCELWDGSSVGTGELADVGAVSESLGEVLVWGKPGRAV